MGVGQRDMGAHQRSKREQKLEKLRHNIHEAVKDTTQHIKQVRIHCEQILM